MVSPSNFPPPSPLRQPRFAIGGCLAFIIGAIGGAALILALLGLRSANPVKSLWSVLRGTTALDMSQPTVVEKIQKLQRLETVVYSMDKVVGGGHTSDMLPDFLVGDRMLMLVHGESVAGIDFSDLRSGDVKLESKRVSIHLPPAQVFSTRLDSARTRVYSRQTGWLVPTDPDLETKVRQEGERQIQEAALADGILKTADQNARTTLISLLQGLGFTEVVFH